MEVIKITFFVLGSFFGIENSRLAAEKVTVTINPPNQNNNYRTRKYFFRLYNQKKIV